MTDKEIIQEAKRLVGSLEYTTEHSRFFTHETKQIVDSYIKKLLKVLGE